MHVCFTVVQMEEHLILRTRKKYSLFLHSNHNEKLVSIIVSFIVLIFLTDFNSFFFHWIEFFFFRWLSQSAWNIFAISPQVCRCVVALCLKTYTRTNTHYTSMNVCMHVCMYVWVYGMCGICIVLCLACCGFGIWCHFASPSLHVFFSFLSWTFLLACTRTHNNARHTNIKFTLNSCIQSHSFVRDLCMGVWVCVCEHVAHIQYSSKTRRCGLLLLSMQYSIFHYMHVSLFKGNVQIQNIMTSRLLMEKRLENIWADKMRWIEKMRKTETNRLDFKAKLVGQIIIFALLWPEFLEKKWVVWRLTLFLLKYFLSIH